MEPKKLKWINRFAPLYVLSGGKVIRKIQDLPQGTVVEATGFESAGYEEVVHCAATENVTGWGNSYDLEDYIHNFPFNSVVIENQTPNLHDFEQYMIYKLQTQVNMCGELCACFILGISLGTILKNWEVKDIPFWKRVFGAGKASGTGPLDLIEMMALFGHTGISLADALFQPHIKRSRYTIKGLNKLLVTGGVIADGVTGLLRGSGILHWISLMRVISERNGQGMVQYYNPAMNCVESCSWNEFLLSARKPYGMFCEIVK